MIDNQFSVQDDIKGLTDDSGALIQNNNVKIFTAAEVLIRFPFPPDSSCLYITLVLIANGYYIIFVITTANRLPCKIYRFCSSDLALCSWSL